MCKVVLWLSFGALQLEVFQLPKWQARMEWPPAVARGRGDLQFATVPFLHPDSVVNPTSSSYVLYKPLASELTVTSNLSLSRAVAPILDQIGSNPAQFIKADGRMLLSDSDLDLGEIHELAGLRFCQWTAKAGRLRNVPGESPLWWVVGLGFCFDQWDGFRYNNVAGWKEDIRAWVNKGNGGFYQISGIS